MKTQTHFFGLRSFVLLLTGLLISLVYSCKSTKKALLSTSEDPIIQDLRKAGWPERAITTFYGSQKKDYRCIFQGNELYLIMPNTTDTSQVLSYNKLSDKLSQKEVNQRAVKICHFSQNLIDRECYTINYHNDTLLIQNFFLQDDSTVLLGMRKSYDSNGALKEYLIQSDSLNKKCEYYNVNMPLNCKTSIVDSVSQVNDTSLTYWHSEEIKGNVYIIDKFQYKGLKTVTNKVTVNTPYADPTTINIGSYNQYTLYSENAFTPPIIYLSLQGQYDLNGDRIGTWKSYNINGELIKETTHNEK